MHKLLVSMEGCSSFLTRFCLVTSLKLPKWARDRTSQQNHPQLSNISAMEMFSLVPPLRSLKTWNQGRTLHHLPTSASSLIWVQRSPEGSSWMRNLLSWRTAAAPTDGVLSAVKKAEKPSSPAQGGWKRPVTRSVRPWASTPGLWSNTFNKYGGQITCTMFWMIWSQWREMSGSSGFRTVMHQFWHIISKMSNMSQFMLQHKGLKPVHDLKVNWRSKRLGANWTLHVFFLPYFVEWGKTNKCVGVLVVTCFTTTRRWCLAAISLMVTSSPWAPPPPPGSFVTRYHLLFPSRKW